MVRLSISFTDGILVVPRALALLINITIATCDETTLEGEQTLGEQAAVPQAGDFPAGYTVVGQRRRQWPTR